MPASGRLDRRMVIQRATTAQDALGQPIETWADWQTVRAGRRDLRAEERFRADQEFATITAVWTTYYIADLTETDRLFADDLIWDILAIDEIGRRSGMEITAEAKV